MVPDLGKVDSKWRSMGSNGQQARGTKQTEPRADGKLPEEAASHTDSSDNGRACAWVLDRDSCVALPSLSEGDEKEFYRGYALVAVFAAVLAVVIATAVDILL